MRRAVVPGLGISIFESPEMACSVLGLGGGKIFGYGVTLVPWF